MIDILATTPWKDELEVVHSDMTEVHLLVALAAIKTSFTCRARQYE